MFRFAAIFSSVLPAVELATSIEIGIVERYAQFLHGVGVEADRQRAHRRDELHRVGQRHVGKRDLRDRHVELGLHLGIGRRGRIYIDRPRLFIA